MTDLMAKETSGGTKANARAQGKECNHALYGRGPSQVDTFDPKPKLNALHKSEASVLEPLNRVSNSLSVVLSSRKVGESGLDMSDQWKHSTEVADELCNYRGCFAGSNHPEALFHMNTGSRLGETQPWCLGQYGLGSVNENFGLCCDD